MSALTKNDLAESLQQQLGLSRKQSKQVIDLFFDEITQLLSSGEMVKLSGFGNFEVHQKVARPGRNPKTGEAVEISARSVVTFHAGQKFKERVKNCIVLDEK